MKKIKKTMSICLIAVLMLSVAPAGFADTASFSEYSDMPGKTHWSYDAVSKAINNGLLSGFGGKISPNGTVTRAQMAAVINSVFGATEKANLSAFTDVDPKAWYYNEMAKAVHLKLFFGSGGKLNPLTLITREQVCVVLANAFNLKPLNDYSLKPFPDKASISAYATDGVEAMVSAGYLKGKNGLLMPKANVSRAELAAMMANLIQTYFNKPGEYEGTFTGNAIINAPGVTFKNAIIKGNLYIGEGIQSKEVVLDGITVMGRLIVKGSVMIAELELLEEEIALGGSNVPAGPVTPGSPSTPMDTTITKLLSVTQKLNNRVMPLLTTPVQRDSVLLINASIAKYIADTSYDISADISAAKVLGSQMSPEEYAYFKNTITGNIPISELVALNNYFKVIEY